jgi:hypothetical protein
MVVGASIRRQILLSGRVRVWGDDGLTIPCPVGLPPFRHAPVTLKVCIVRVARREMSHAKPQPPVQCACCRIGPCINDFDVYYRRANENGQTRSCLRHGARGEALLGF